MTTATLSEAIKDGIITAGQFKQWLKDHNENS